MNQTLAEKLLVLYHTSRSLEYTETGGIAALEWSQSILKQLDAQNVEPPEKEDLDSLSDYAEPKIRVGTTVTWKYGTGTATGKVSKIYTDSVTLKLGESEVARNGTVDNPALLIKQENGAKVLKLASEVRLSASDYAEPDPKIDPADLYTSQAIALAAPIFSEWLETLEDHLFDNATDLSEVRSRIDSAFSEMDSKDFAALMSDVLLTSYSAGRYQVTTEAEDDDG